MFEIGPYIQKTMLLSHTEVTELMYSRQSKFDNIELLLGYLVWSLTCLCNLKCKTNIAYKYLYRIIAMNIIIIVTSRNASLSTKSKNIQNIINEADLGSSDKPPKFKK